MKIKTIFAILVFFILFGTTAFAATGIITNASSGLILRSEPSKSGNVIFTIANGKEVEILSKEGDWYKVKYNNQEGYLFAEYVKPVEVEAPTETSSTASTNQENTASANSDFNIYLMPQITSTIILTVPKDTQITVIEEVGKWSYITVNNTSGWIRTTKIKNEEQNNETVVNANQQENIEQPKEEKQPEKVEPTPEATTGLKKGYINVDSANVRENPSVDSKVVTTLLLNTGVSITEETGEWYKINFQDKYFGYVAKKLISANPQNNN